MKGRNKRDNKTKYLLILLLLIAVGYAAIATTLKINGTSTIKSAKWDVYWENPQVLSGSVTNTAPTLSESDTKATFNVTLNEPGDYYEFTIDAVNNGSLDAKIDTNGIVKQVKNSSGEVVNPTILKYEVTNNDQEHTAIQEGHILAKKSGSTPTKETYRVRVEYRNDEGINPSDLDDSNDLVFTIEFSVKYVQGPKASNNSGSNTPTYSYYGRVISSEDPTGYDFDYEDYQDPSNNNECPEYYAYYEGDGEHSAGCYYINDGYCDNGYYNSDTNKCEDEGYHENVPFSNDWIAYIRNDGTTPEACGVFGSGQSGTVCLTGSYYNSNYNNDDNYYYADFADVSDTTEGITTSSGLSATGLKGYSLTKAQEMLSKGASSCYVSSDHVHCDIPSGGNCSIDYGGGAYCYADDYDDSCCVYNDGSYNCD